MADIKKVPVSVIDERVLRNQHSMGSRIIKSVLSVGNEDVSISGFSRNNVANKLVIPAIRKIKKPPEGDAVEIGEQAALNITFIRTNLQDMASLAVARPHTTHCQLGNVVIHVEIVRVTSAVTVAFKNRILHREIAEISSTGFIEKPLHIVVNKHVAHREGIPP